eukprot:TRINITY_DN30264_c0_g1_i1.p1 TRINITY_DN30264_c0_g1~~TRINITY_DN30264_c0_g1_i1.p1  ORF type:complete len:195 (+),score=46.65 TRINITY_DN30264_c0_g1_i1:66-650(+)
MPGDVESASACDEGSSRSSEGSAHTWGKPPAGVMFFEDAVDEAFCAMLDEVRDDTPVSLTSGKMYANRRFLRDDALGNKVCKALPHEGGISRVCSDLRFIEYDVGGYIVAHVDGVRRDAETDRDTTTSLLLFLSTVPEGEGGETEFLADINDEDSVLFAVRPKRGAVLLFPHSVPHRGACVGQYPKILLRGDMY